jgi:hypothetical protein
VRDFGYGGDEAAYNQAKGIVTTTAAVGTMVLAPVAQTVSAASGGMKSGKTDSTKQTKTTSNTGATSGKTATSGNSGKSTTSALKLKSGKTDAVGQTKTAGNAGTRESIKGAGKTIGFNAVESKIINEAKKIINSSEFAKIKDAHKAGQSVTVNIEGRIIQYEPELNASGMTMFGENGFLIGNEAFTSNAELSKTVLHELYRLNTSVSATGVSAELAAQETNAAFDFAIRAFKELVK